MWQLKMLVMSEFLLILMIGGMIISLLSAIFWLCDSPSAYVLSGFPTWFADHHVWGYSIWGTFVFMCTLNTIITVTAIVRSTGRPRWGGVWMDWVDGFHCFFYFTWGLGIWCFIVAIVGRIDVLLYGLLTFYALIVLISVCEIKCFLDWQHMRLDRYLIHDRDPPVRTTNAIPVELG